jgi:pimeloyl-ACP methyl ester carboxylesterase
MNRSKGRTIASNILSACLSLACLVGAGWTTRATAAPAKVSFEREKFTIDKRPAFTISPAKKLAGPTPWVLYAPTLGRGLPGKAEHWMFRQFLEAGIAIAGVDVGESYGSPKGRATYNALHKRLTEKHGFAQKACLLARSRGGLMLYCWAAENPEKVKCAAGIYPVCNIASYPGLKRACGAYGLTAKQLETDLSKHNPPDRLAELAKANVPIFHIHGDVDRVVPLAANSGLLAKRYKAAGGKMELLIAKGQGHNMWRGFFECQQLVDFVIKHAVAVANPLARTIQVGGVTFDPASPPKPLVTRRDLGLVTAPAVEGQLVHESKQNLFETRATITPGGDYLLMFPEGKHYGGRKGKVNTMIAYRSSDKGKTWTGPKAAFNIDYSQHGFIPLIPRGTKRIYAFGTQPIEGKREGRENCPIGFRYSDDDGRTWSNVTLIRPKNNPDFLGMSVMRMCETDAGTWLLGSHEGRWKRTPKGPVGTRAYVLRSEDKGKTWTVLPGKRPGGWYLEKFERLDEPRPINLGGGKAMILARSCEGHLFETRSNDDGKTWSKPKPTALVHPDAPPMLFHHPDGKTLIAFHHNRHSGGHFKQSDRSEIWVSLSADQGQSWSEPRFVFANALAPKKQSGWYNHQCSYMDMFADGQDLHLFIPHRWKRAMHLHLKASDLEKLPTKTRLKSHQ